MLTHPLGWRCWRCVLTVKQRLSSSGESFSPNIESNSKSSDVTIIDSEKDCTPSPSFSDRPSEKCFVSGNEDVPRIILLGSTGAGKSHIGNTLLGKTSFKVSDGPGSSTSVSEGVKGLLLGKNGFEFEIIDTPGFNDSGGRDTEHIQDIVENLRKLKFVTMFLIVITGHEIRMTKEYSNMLRMFELCFGCNFWDHAMFGVTGSLKEKERTKAGKWIETISRKFPHAKAVKTVFLNQDQDGDGFNSNVATLWEACYNMHKFVCQNIKEVLREKDELERQKEQISLEKQEAINKMEALVELTYQEKQEYKKRLTEIMGQAAKGREEERKIVENEMKEEKQKLLEKCKEKEGEVEKIMYDIKVAGMERDAQLKILEKEKCLKEVYENENGRHGHPIRKC